MSSEQTDTPSTTSNGQQKESPPKPPKTGLKMREIKNPAEKKKKGGPEGGEKQLKLF